VFAIASSASIRDREYRGRNSARKAPDVGPEVGLEYFLSRTNLEGRGGPRPGSATLDTLPTDKFHARLIDRLVRARFSFF
jgi:hypothetical protein